MNPTVKQCPPTPRTCLNSENRKIFYELWLGAVIFVSLKNQLSHIILKYI